MSEREITTNQLANLAAPDRLTPADIDALMTELGGLTTILGAATPPGSELRVPRENVPPTLGCQVDATTVRILDAPCVLRRHDRTLVSGTA